MFKKIFAIAVLGSLISCSKDNSDGIQPREEVRANSEIRQSFSLVNIDTPVLGVDKSKIFIAKKALEKEFLFQASLIPQPNAATGTGMRSHVVAFRLRGNSVFMMEAVQGHTVTTDLPQNMILAEFPVLEETADQVSFDFNKGMSAIFAARDWYSQDSNGKDYEPANTFAVIKVNHSYLESAETKNEKLVIRQIAQISSIIEKKDAEESESEKTPVLLPVEVRYYISPYLPNLKFKPVQQTSFDRMGFFEVAPFINSRGMSIVRATKWDHSRPIVYAISSNTPAEFKEAVRDGILYWNKAFGAEVVKVVEAPAGVTAPDADYNIVQWVPWDLAGFAYADAQMDPRSGEILHAQVYLTSAFAFLGKIRGQKVIYNLKKPSNTLLTLKGFGTSQLCNYDVTEQLQKAAVDLIVSGADDAQALKAAQDYVRDVTAHEVGHTLGLRHNFAGNLASNIPSDQRQPILKKYFETGNAPENAITSSSMMEYEVFDDSIISGDQAAKAKKAKDYDEKVIQTLYNGKKYADSEIPLFCTDTHKLSNQFADCQTFDYGSSYFEWVKSNLDTQLRELPFDTFVSMMRAMKPVFGEDTTSAEKVVLRKPSEVAKALLIGRDVVVNQFTTKGGFLKVQRQFTQVSESNRSEVRKTELNYMQTDLARLGGLNEVLSLIPSVRLDDVYNRFAEVVDSHQSGIDFGGKPYTLTSAEMTAMKTQVRQWVDQIKKELVKADLKVLRQTDIKEPPKFVDHPVSAELVSVLVARAKHYVSTTNNEVIIADIEVPGTPNSKMVTVKLPKYEYEFKVRKAAAGLLNDDRGEAVDWAFTERNAFKTEFANSLNQALNTSIDKLKPESMPPAVTRWFLENTHILATLTGK